MRDRSIENAIRAVKDAQDAVEIAREKVWSLIQKDPSYGLIVLKGFRLAGSEFFRASIALDCGLSALADVEVIDRAGIC